MRLSETNKRGLLGQFYRSVVHKLHQGGCDSYILRACTPHTFLFIHESILGLL